MSNIFAMSIGFLLGVIFSILVEITKDKWDKISAKSYGNKSDE